MKTIKLSLFTILLCFATKSSLSQDFQKTFKSLAEKKDTSGQLVLLKKWEAANPTDAEMFIAWFNYYAQQSMSNVLSLEKDPKDKNGTSGYITAANRYQPAILQKGFNYIDKGIRLYPTRLDMRFGKVYMLGEEGNFKEFTRVLIETIDYDNTIKSAWLWKEGKPREDSKAFFLGTMQSYVMTIYNTENDGLLPLMREISTAVLKYNPDHVESLANVALTHIIAKEYDLALPFLLKAEKINPKDVIVLNNIAQVYARKKDTPNANIYYQKIIALGDAEETAHAKEQMKKLD